MKQPFVVIETRGSAWDDSRQMDDQTGFPAHATFVDSLVAERFILLGGPLEGTRDLVLVIQAKDCSQIMGRMAGDAWIQNGLLSVRGCKPWRIRLGSLRLPADVVVS